MIKVNVIDSKMKKENSNFLNPVFSI